MPRYEALYASRRDSAAIRPERGPEPRDIAWPGMNTPTRDAAEASRSKIRSGPVGDFDSQKGVGLGCRPWLKVERDEKKYEACMRIAERIGPIDSPKKAFEILKEAVGSEDAEIAGFISLDTHMYLRGLAETGRGEMDAVMFPIGSTLRTALADGATAIILFHVHPTLYTEPSDADKDVTRAFERGCEAVDILLMDHLVCGGAREFFSFAEKGLLK